MHIIETRQVNWPAMPDMGEEALDGFSPSDSPMFRNIRDALVRNDALDIFGLYLIHKHFDISADEEMIEDVDFNQEIVRIRPRLRSEINIDAMVPTNWFFAPEDRDSIVVHITQWGKRDDMPGADCDPFRTRYASCFAEIREILRRNDSLERFGMFLQRHQFSFEDNENQLECTDHELRTLTLNRQFRSNDNDRSIPTNWYFTPDETIAVGCCECARNSNGHLGYHRQV